MVVNAYSPKCCLAEEASTTGGELDFLLLATSCWELQNLEHQCADGEVALGPHRNALMDHWQAWAAPPLEEQLVESKEPGHLVSLVLPRRQLIPWLCG